MGFAVLIRPLSIQTICSTYRRSYDYGGAVLKARLGIRVRILSIALVPSLALCLGGTTVAADLLKQGLDAKTWAAKIDRDSAPGIDFAIQTQEERRLTLMRIGGDDQHTADLAAARGRVDQAVRTLVAAGDGFSQIDPTLLAASISQGKELVSQLPAVRIRADSGTLPADDAYTYFNQLIGVAAGATELFPRVSPTPAAADDEATATRLLHVAEAMSRGNALAAVALPQGGITAPHLREYVDTVGFYRTELRQLIPHLTPMEQDSLQALMTSEPWRRLSATEDAVIQRGSVTTTTGARTSETAKPEPLPMSIAEWQQAATQVSVELLGLWQAQHRYALRSAAAEGDRIARNSLIGGGVALSVAIAAFLVALWLSSRLIRRLRLLRCEALALADKELPRIMNRLREGLPVDLDADITRLDHGIDELGQVAAAFNRAQHAAVGAAVAEAKTRNGVNTVFLNIAYRSQLVVHRLLEVLDRAERDQEDPAQLALLFQLDHLSTRARRNAENLIILGGGQPGRQWRNPVPLRELTRSAVGEAENYSRAHIGRFPPVSIVGNAVADIIHLLAELVDNATAFSPPESKVEITGTLVGKGVAIEITDQGLGMAAEEIDQANRALGSPPDFGVSGLGADSRLGLFVVARLAVRNGASVRLSESHFGGIRAIVLLPNSLIAAESITDPPLTPAPAQSEPTRAIIAPEPAHMSESPIRAIDFDSGGKPPAATSATAGQPCSAVGASDNRRRRPSRRATCAVRRSGARADVGHRNGHPAGPRVDTGQQHPLLRRPAMISSKAQKLDWLLDDLVRRLPGVRHAVVLSTDGLLLGRSTAMSVEDAEHFAAMSCALYSLARSAGQHFAGGGVRQSVVELDQAVLFVTAAGANACLALMTSETANLGLVAYEMNQTVQRVGTFLAAAPRGGPR